MTKIYNTNPDLPLEESPISFCSKLIFKARKTERERIVKKIRNSKMWKLVPNTPRMIMISDKELDELLESIYGDK